MTLLFSYKLLVHWQQVFYYPLEDKFSWSYANWSKFIISNCIMLKLIKKFNLLTGLSIYYFVFQFLLFIFLLQLVLLFFLWWFIFTIRYGTLFFVHFLNCYTFFLIFINNTSLSWIKVDFSRFDWSS